MKCGAELEPVVVLLYIHKGFGPLLWVVGHFTVVLDWFEVDVSARLASSFRGVREV